MLNDRTYNLGKKAVQIYIPATSAAYFGLAQIWGLPAAEQVVGTLAIVATFLGTILQISNAQYQNSDKAYDGDVVVQELATGEKTFMLRADLTPEEVAEKDSIRFKVVPEDISDDST